MKVEFADLNFQYKIIQKNYKKNFLRIISDSSFIGGFYLDQFEKKFAEFCNIKYCLGVGNGTDALEIAIQSLNLPKNSEIIIPANTFIATAEAVIRSGHRVCFADVHYDNSLIDESKIENCINKKTSAIIPVHLYGQSCEMKKIIQIAKKNNLKVIEDCSQAHGALFMNKHVGTFGDIGTFSFYPGKNLGGFGDGGAIISNNFQIIKKCKRISNHGRLKKFDHLMIGRNSRLDNLQAAVLIEKIKHLPDWIESRNFNASLYNKFLDLKYIELPVLRSNRNHTYHLYVIKLKKRNLVKKLLQKAGISSGIHYPNSLDQNKIFNKVNKNPAVISNYLSKKILSLPVHESLSKNKLIYTCNVLNKIVRGTY